MSKHKHVETAAHVTNAAPAAPHEAPAADAAPVAPVAPVASVAPEAHAAVAAPEAAAPAAVTTPAAAAASMASTLYGVGVVWAQKGIGLGKTALEGLARALDRGAKMLGELQTQIKVNAEKSAV
jgi:cell pole-organizing protein PopZ